jgi:hypothetical protein
MNKQSYNTVLPEGIFLEFFVRSDTPCFRQEGLFCHARLVFWMDFRRRIFFLLGEFLGRRGGQEVEGGESVADGAREFRKNSTVFITRTRIPVAKVCNAGRLLACLGWY